MRSNSALLMRKRLHAKQTSIKKKEKEDVTLSPFIVSQSTLDKCAHQPEAFGGRWSNQVRFYYAPNISANAQHNILLVFLSRLFFLFFYNADSDTMSPCSQSQMRCRAMSRLAVKTEFAPHQSHSVKREWQTKRINSTKSRKMGKRNCTMTPRFVSFILSPLLSNIDISGLMDSFPVGHNSHQRATCE